jgi:hypothetical protein
LGVQEFRYFDFIELGIWLCGPSNRWTRYDWDRLPNPRDVCFELSEFPEALFQNYQLQNDYKYICLKRLFQKRKEFGLVSTFFTRTMPWPNLNFLTCSSVGV